MSGTGQHPCTDDRGGRSAAHRVAPEVWCVAEAIFDRAGRFSAWLLIDRLVGAGGGTQAWIRGGAIYSRAGTHIGSLSGGLIRGMDGTISGFAAGSPGVPARPVCGAPPPVPAVGITMRRPRLRSSPEPRRDARPVWSTHGWSGFLVPRVAGVTAESDLDPAGAVPLLAHS